MSASDERQMEDDNELLGKRLTVENFPLTDEGLRAAANRMRLVQLKFELATLQEGNCSACDTPINPRTAILYRTLPYSKGGRDRMEDTTLLCEECGDAKLRKKQLSTHVPARMYDKVVEWRDATTPEWSMSQVTAFALEQLVSTDRMSMDRDTFSDMTSKAEEADATRKELQSMKKMLKQILHSQGDNIMS